MADILRELILPRCEAVRKSGAGFMVRCPAHDDGKASLAVAPGRDQPVLIKCFAGCDPEDILAKWGLTWADLSAPREHRLDDGEWTPAGPAVAVYDYRDENGELLFQVCRTANKDFLQRTPDATAKSGWRWKLGDTRRVLYRLPKVIQAVNDGLEVYLCEGEKDVHTLEAHGLVASCNPGGAGKWRPEYSEFLRDAVVTIVADKDNAGQAHARQVREALTGIAAAVYTMEAAEGCKDATDHVNAGHSLADLILTWSSEQDTKVELAPDVWEFLAAEDEPYDWIVPDLLERGDRLILTGFEGLGKSMLTRQLAATMAAGVHPFQWHKSIDQQRVLVIDCENSERQSRRKYRLMADASVKQGSRIPDGGLRLIHKPAGIDLTRQEWEDWLMERVTAHKPDVLFIGPFYRLHEANMNEELPARKTVAVLDRARTEANCALIIEAHSGHGEHGKSRSVRPTGSSLLLRWPEFGIGLTPTKDPEPGRPCMDVALHHWRGQRDERRWPAYLTWGDPGDWPWKVSLGQPK